MSAILQAGGRPVLVSTLICPACGRESSEAMPTDACQYLWDCPRCAALVRPKAGDCCVFCSYGSVPCPPKQAELINIGCCR
ncbi:MAG TPA: GDCCVxC domain-containing (seleno)protein [Alphaproteobacteria bacterium]|nr:GDCCVxC domain-containing (seleno)protein [Alphaproteobacteria bacterium]